jgi:hypothetical protein
MATVTPAAEVGHALIPAGDGWFDRLARIAARDTNISRRSSLKLAAGVTATALVASWVRPARAVTATGPSDCAGTRNPYVDGCFKPVPKQNYKPTSNGCGPEKGFIKPPQSPLGVATFTPACNKHDECYGTCNSGKATCDLNFFNDMAAICAHDYPGGGIFDNIGLGFCVQLAANYATAVGVGGGDAYQTGQQEGCDCCDECSNGQTQCGDKCCPVNYECSNGACCSSCGNYIKCNYPAPLGQCDFGCCNPTTICCPHPNGTPRCCPPNLCCNGVCTTC